MAVDFAGAAGVLWSTVGRIRGSGHVNSGAGVVSSSSSDAGTAGVCCHLGLKRGHDRLKAGQRLGLGWWLLVGGGRAAGVRAEVAAVRYWTGVTALVVRAGIMALVIREGITALVVRAGIAALVVRTRHGVSRRAEVPTFGTGVAMASQKRCLRGPIHRVISGAT